MEKQSKLLKNGGLYSAIVYKIEEKYKIRFSTNKSHFTIILDILTNPLYHPFRKYLIQILKYYEIDERMIIYHLINKMQRIENPEFMKKMMASYYESLPYFSEIIKFGSKYFMNTEFGYVMVSSFRELLEKEDRKTYDLCNGFRDRNENAIDIFLNNFSEGVKGITIQSSLDGERSQSHFIYVGRNDRVLDISNNTVYYQNTFENIMPYELVTWPKSNDTALIRKRKYHEICKDREEN